eukprot:m.311719 g.311719  ORF g.311719 m.311719 type:complete len:56 (+) comp128948_c0_seq1:75-242(+)
MLSGDTEVIISQAFDLPECSFPSLPCSEGSERSESNVVGVAMGVAMCNFLFFFSP